MHDSENFTLSETRELLSYDYRKHKTNVDVMEE